MTTKLKWKRGTPGIVIAMVGNVELWVYSTQYGTYPSTKRFHYQIRRVAKPGENELSRDPVILQGGTSFTQAHAKQEAVRSLREIKRRVA